MLTFLPYLVLFVASLAIRLIFVTQTMNDAALTAPVLDIGQYWEAARLIRTGAPYSYELAACSAPLFAHFLAFVQRVFGDSMLAAQVVLASLGSLRIAVVYWTAKRFGVRPLFAFVGAGLLVWLPSLVYFDTVVLKASLDVTLLASVIALVALNPLSRTGKVIRGLVLGVVLGLAFLNQLNTVLYVFPVVVAVMWAAAPRRREGLYTAVPAVCVFLVVFSGFQMREHYGPVESYLPRVGAELQVGLGPKATGYYVSIDGVAGSPYGHAFEARMRAEIAEARPLSPKEADAHWVRQTVDYVTEHPGKTARLMATKLGYFFNNYEIIGIHYAGAVKQSAAIVSHSPFGFGLLVVFATLGFLALLVQRKWGTAVLLVGIAGALAATTLVTLVTWRFRLPVIVPLAILSAFGVEFLWVAVRSLVARGAQHAGRNVALVLIPGLASLWVAYRPILSGEKSPKAGFMKFAENMRRVGKRHQRRRSELPSLGADTNGLRAAKLLASVQHHTEAQDALSRWVDTEAHQRRRALAKDRRLMRMMSRLAAVDRAKKKRRRRLKRSSKRVERKKKRVVRRRARRAKPRRRSRLTLRQKLAALKKLRRAKRVFDDTVWADTAYLRYLIWRGKHDRVKSFVDDLRETDPAYYGILERRKGIIGDYLRAGLFSEEGQSGPTAARATPKKGGRS